MTYPYLPPDRYITLNDGDSDLFPIRIDVLDLIRRTHRQYNLPEPTDFPPLHEVHGYGIPPEDQVFEREEIPQSLVQLEQRIRLVKKKAKNMTAIKLELTTIGDFWDAIETNPERYADEIDWLKRMWRYRLLGKFLFINGKVHYIPGWYWFFLNWYYLDDVRPEYRYWDNLMAIGWKWASLDTTTFANIDPDTRKPIPNADGTYDMIDTGHRVCLGVNDPKSRRVGDTSKAQCFGMEEATRSYEYHDATQGRDDPHSKKVFQQQFIRPFEKMPIFFKPVWDSILGVKPKEYMLFDGDTADYGLHTRITHATSANAENYNGDKLNFYHRDESGSTINENVNLGHQIIRHCLALGGKIIGMAMYTSTVDKIEAGSAGENYMKLCMDSHYEQRTEDGRTVSGMYNIFIPAEKRVEGFIDKYGYPITGKPTPEQQRYIGKDHGSLQWIESNVKELTRKKDWTNLAIFQRQYPRKFREAFSPPGKNQFFPIELIRNRVQHLQFIERSLLPVRGDFEWTNGFGSDVVWIPNDKGRWFLSHEFKPTETNRRRFLGGIWYPENPLSVAHAADVFGSDRTKGRASLGGLAARLLYDESVDPKSKPMDMWVTDRLIITYKNRPDGGVDEFCEDCLKQVIYCGGLMYPERNKDHVEPYFRRHGFDGYLLFDYDHQGKQASQSAGFYTQQGIKQKIFNFTQKELVKNISRERHTDWMDECMNILSPEQMTDFDLFTAVGGTLLAANNPYYQIMRRASTYRVDTGRFLPEEVY